MAFQVLTAAVFAAQAIGTATSAVLTAAAAAGTAGLAAAASLASIAYTSYATKKAEADARKNAAQAPRDITVRSATEPAKVIYGTARTSGPVVYTNTAPTPGTNDNNTLWTVISLCSHEVEDITDIWLDGDEITASQINWGGTGGVTSGKYGPIGSNQVTNFYKRLGTSTQSHVSELATAFTDWTSSYQGKNVAYIVSAFELGTATGEGVWAQGAPTNIRAVVKGKKVYDPRKDTTNGGSGAHRLADPTTWEWSNNPALCLADYLFDDRLGLGAEGVTYDDIDWALVIAAANICDATVSTPAGNEKRFTCNGALSTGNTYAENIKAILSSMNGQITWSGGKYRIRACAYEAPVYTFTGDDVVGDVQIQPERTRTQRFNTVRGTFVDPESDYVATEFIPYNDSNLQSGRDAGQKLTKDISLPMTNSEYMAQRIGYKMVALNDQQLRCIVPMNWKALKVGVGDRIQLSIDELSWSNKVFRVEGWTFDPDSGFNLTLQEDSSSAYADPGVSDYSTRTLAGTVVFADQPVPSPSNLSASAEEEAVFLQWANPGRASGYDEIIVYASATSAWSGASEIARTRGTSYRHELARNTQRYYWIRAVDVDGETSIRNPNSDTSAITATSGQIDFANLGGATKPEDNATYNTGALADKDTVGEADIDNGAVTINKFGTGLEPVQVVASLPGTATAGQMAFLTTDNKLYRYNGTAWTAAVPFGDVTGAGALAALDTITLTYVTDAGDVAALNSISETYIDDNSITTVKINANAVTAAKIQANTITAAQIAANTITANQIAANTITANQIAANTITSNEIAANTITAGQIAAGTITADELAANAVTGQIFDASSYLRAGSGDNSAVMSGRSIDEYAFWAGKGFETDGGPSGADAPFRVTRDGKVIMTNFALYSEAGTKLFDSQDGLLALPQTAVAQASGSLVPQVSEELTSGTDTFTVTLSSTQTITANFAYPVGALFYSGTSLTDAQNNVSSAFAVTLEYSTDSGSTWNTFGSTQNFSKVTSGTPTSSQYLVIANSFTVSIIYGATPTTVYVASLQSNRGAIDEGMTLVGSTSQSLAAGTYLIRMAFSATGGSGTGAPATDKTREVRLSTSGAGFTVSDGTVSDGVGTSATTGWVLQNFVEKTESDNVTINGTLTLGGDLVVNGTTTTINSTTLEVADKNIVLADGAANAAAADGAGITIDGASASLTYHSTTDSFRFNKATAFGFNNIDVDAFGSYAGGFGTVQDGSGWSARGLFVHGGGTGDGATIAHNGSGLYFGIQNNAAANSLATWLYVSPSKVIDFNGTLSMSGTSFMDSSRNLSSIGTISSGAITASGTSAINNFRLTDSSKMGFGTVKSGGAVSHTASTEEGIFWHLNTDYGVYRTSGSWGSPDYQQMRIKWVTGIELDGGSAYGKSGVNIINSDLQIGGTTVIDSGRAISAASMTTSGAVAVGGGLDVDGIIDNTYNNGNVSAPSTSDHTAGTRIKFYDANATAFYAMGIESNTLWFNSNSNYKFYRDAVLKVDFDANGVVNAVGGYKVGGTEIINSSGSVVGAPTITLANDARNTALHRIAVFDSGTTSYGMMLWNDNGSSGDWGTMIYGPNQANRTISFGKIIDSTFTNHGDVSQIAYFDLDNGNFVHKGQTGYDTTIRAYGQGSSDDALIQLLGQGNNPGQEGFEIWYSNSVGDVSLSTTYSNAAADMHFRTATGASKSTSNTRLTLHGDGNATFYANANSHASLQSIATSNGYNYINIAAPANYDTGIIFSEGDGNTVTNRRMMIGYDATTDFLRFYTYYKGDGTTAVNGNRAYIDTDGNFSVAGGYLIDGSAIITSNREIDSSRSTNSGHISKFNNTNTGTAAYSEIWVQNGTTADRLVLGYSKNYSASEWSGKGWVYSATGPLALKAASTLQLYTGGLDDNDISATYDSSGNYSHLRGNASFDNQVKIKASSHPSASGVALTVGDNAGEGLRFGVYGHLLSSDTHIAHNIYYTGSAWAQIASSLPSSTIKLGSGSAADILFGYTDAGSTSINYAYEFPKSGKARFDTSLTIGGDDIGTRNGLSVTSAGTKESQAVFQSASYGSAFGILSHNNVTYLSQNLYYDGSWVHDSYGGEQRNALLAIRTQSSGHGIYWYASDNGSGSWNVASDVQLFNGYGYCTADITTNNFRSTAPRFLTSETLELGDYGSSWGHPYISMASSWAGGTYPTIGSTGGSAGSLIMLHNPHIPFRTDNNASGQTGKGGIRCAINANASTYYDIGTYSMTGVTEGFQVARGGVRYIYTTGDDNVIFADNIYVDNGNLRIGDQAFSQSTDYVGMKTAFQSGSGDYMIISGTSDGNTYVSAKSASSVFIRGGGNLSSNQIQVSSTTITATTSNFISSGNVTAYSDERLKSDVQTLDGAKVLAMRGVSFTKDGEAGSGVIAQELEKVAPELVHTADDEMGTKSVAYGNLVGYLIEAVKMQQQQIDELKALLKEKDNGND